ncbi:MAG: purine nucleosidase [Chloroflexota bacterium]|nr:purine nucleosidase [Chloroflexota bacterium]
MTAPIPTIIDCDTGIDDSLALLYAAASPEMDLLAVTCVSGNVEARQVAENTRALLELVGRDDVEVAIGREVPLVRDLMTTPETHGPRGIGYAELPEARTPLSQRHAADLIIEEARRRPGELLLITLGPLTNLAVAVLREPELPSLLGGLVMMGGSYRSPGNTAPTTEWNVAVDPEAMQVVLRAFAARETAVPGARPLPRALGLDVTERAKFEPYHLAQLVARGGGEANPVMQFVTDALRFYMEFHSRYDGFYGAHIHDALAVAAALDPALVRYEALPVEVELGGTLTYGETVTDWRRRWGKPPNLEVGVDADIPGFFERFIERVGSLAASRAGVAR